MDPNLQQLIQYERHFHAAADWLCRFQEQDGNIPAVVTLLGGTKIKTNLLRLGVAAWGLAEFGKTTNRPRYINGAKNAFAYLQKHIWEAGAGKVPYLPSAFTYFGHLAWAIGAKADGNAAAEKILGDLAHIPYQPIVCAQIAGLFRVLAPDDEKFAAAAEKLVVALKKDFDHAVAQKKTEMNLAIWAELVNAIHDTDPAFAEKICSWLRNLQHPDGSFPESTRSRFPYARGAGKIFEVLSWHQGQNIQAISRLLPWLLSMQYNEKNFFVPTHARVTMTGSFRHDYHNTDAWIDAIGHTLLGGSRLLNAIARLGGVETLPELKTKLNAGEMERDTSTFLTSLELRLEPTHRIPDSDAMQFSDSFRGENDPALKKITARLYQWLDSLSGKTSYAPDHPMDAYEPYFRILHFLQKEGVISNVFCHQNRINDAPYFHKWSLSPAFPPGITDGRPVHTPSLGHGFSKHIEIALSKAIGEFLERYPLLLYRKDNFLRASCRELKKNGYSLLHPSHIAGFSAEQMAREERYRFDEPCSISWVRIQRVRTGKKLLAPAQLIFWNYLLEDNEPLLRELNTNGAGGYFTKEKAILSALYELIQRDAFLIYWLNRVAPPRIDPRTVPDEEFQMILRESERYGFAVHCLNTTLDLTVPSVAMVITDTSGRGPYFSLGGGCDASLAKALHRALEEAWSVYTWMRGHPAFTIPHDYQPFRDGSVGQHERLQLAANPNMAHHYDFFLSGPEKPFDQFPAPYPTTFPSEEAELDYAIRTIERHGAGYEVYCYLAKNSLLKKLGYYAARVIVPELVPLYLNEINAPLGASRLKSVPPLMGYPAAEHFNPIPHPFP